MSQSIKEEYSFIGYLQGLLQAKDRSVARAAMARLRCGLGKQPGTVYEMDRYVLSKLPEKADEEAYYLVAALFAYWHQGKDKAILGGSNFGRSLQLLRDSYANEDTSPGTFEEKREKHAKRLEKRLNALLAANREDLP